MKLRDCTNRIQDGLIQRCTHPLVNLPSHVIFSDDVCRRCARCDLGDREYSPRPIDNTGQILVGDSFATIATAAGFSGATSCGCETTRLKMNRLGPEGCRRQLESLAAEVVFNAKKKSVELCEDAAKALVLEAIRRAELLRNEILHDSNLADLPRAGPEDANLDLNSP